MANVRDPAFWRRFSVAVHLDEEQNTTPDTKSASSNGSRPPIKHTYVLQICDDADIANTHLTSESWLDRHHKKQRRTKCIGWLIVLFTVIVVVAIVLVVLWLLKMGMFQRKS
jgi:hypothetical protein